MTTPSPTKKFSVDTALLEFDRHNPRLVALPDLQQATDQQIMCALVNEADIGELINSIVANGYMDIEPLVVTRNNCSKPGNFRVLEGNRRLSAIRFLKEPKLARICRLSLPAKIPDSVYGTLQEVTVHEVENEIESRAFIGFKHINGAHRWDSYAKACFLSQWYIDDYQNGITIESIAAKLGDTNQTVRSLIGGMLVLKQAEEAELFNIKDRTKPGKFGFSHLYTALGRLEYRKFLELDKNWNARPDLAPIKKERLNELKDMLQYIYGSKTDDIQSVIKSQNPDLKHLGMTLVHPYALKILKSTNNLAQAYDEVRSSSDVFQDALIIAHTKVKDVMNKLSKFSPKENADLLKMAGEMFDNADSIYSKMKKRIEENNSSKK